MRTFTFEDGALQAIFEHYIERRIYVNNSIGYDKIWASGECKECERWLTLFGIDLSYERIQPMIDGKKEIKVFD